MKKNVIFEGKDWVLLFKYEAFKMLGDKWGLEVIQDIQLKLGELMQKMTTGDLTFIIYAGLKNEKNDKNLTQERVRKWIDSDESPTFGKLALMIVEEIAGDLPKIDKPREFTEKKKI